uniref:Zinc finger C5HC2-type domain-containing protein n=2 Tax=Lotharella globosa TaxID=91324 RepID=A0A7S3Z226_9EUKA
MHELKLVFEEETRLRRKAIKAGVETLLPMDTRDEEEGGPKKEEEVPYGSRAEGPGIFNAPREPKCKQCHLCHQHCYLSYMTCFCPNQDKVVCLNHIRYLCACKPRNKALFIRHTSLEDPSPPGSAGSGVRRGAGAHAGMYMAAR